MDKPALRRMRPLFGSLVDIAVRAPVPLAEAGLDAAFAAIENVQQQMSFFDPDSDLSRINLHAWRRPVSVNPSTYRMLCLARHMARGSAGLFDFTAGGRLVREGRLPDHGFPDLDSDAGWEALDLLPRLRVRLKRPVVLTLDGIARGFAVDAAVRALLNQGVTRGVISAGRDLRMFGPDPMPIAVQEAGGTTTSLGVWSNTAMATSGVGLGVEDRLRLPSCMLTPDGCDDPACPHFHACPRAWTIKACEAWRAQALVRIAASAPVAERAERVARLGGRLIDASAT